MSDPATAIRLEPMRNDRDYPDDHLEHGGQGGAIEDEDERPLLRGEDGGRRDRVLGVENGRNRTTGIFLRYCLSFFFLGLLNNVLYVIVLSAALDLVPASVPKGVVLLFNILPSLLVKLGWPYLVSGPVRYAKRVIGCTALSFVGMVVVALSSSLFPRLLGISLASFSSGLGEMTYLQLSTCYGSDALGTKAVGWFASGTGGAGIVGAGLWWVLRGVGVQAGLGMSSVLPLCMAAVYFALLPSQSAMASIAPPDPAPTYAAYTAVPTGDPDAISASLTTPVSRVGEGREPIDGQEVKAVLKGFSAREKLALARPLVYRYMLPLFLVYLAEYTINTGIAPVLVYPVPSPQEHPIASHFIKTLRDYYPLWQLTYQCFVFLSRSSTSLLRLPALPARLIPLPSVFQLFLLILALLEASTSFLSTLFGPRWIYFVVWTLIGFEGIFGGTAYVACYHWLGIEDFGGEEAGESREEKIAKREFRVSAVGFADTCGILAASLVSSWLEPTLCGIQVRHGRTLCKEV